MTLEDAPAAVSKAEAAEQHALLRLECALDPGEGVRALLRHPLLAPHLPKPARWRAETLTWFEVAELGEAALLEQRRREPPLPVSCRPLRAVPCLPGTLPPPPAWDAPGQVPPRALAAFVGRKIGFVAQGVELEVVQGRLRAVAGEALAARVWLRGPPADVIGLAARLAEALPLLPAAVPLAEAARAIALGQPPRVRRQGAPELGEAATVEEGLLAAAPHLLDVLLAETPAARLGAGPRGVHQSRVAIRRLRSVVRLFRPLTDGPAMRDWDAALSAVARALGEARDWDVFQAGTAQPLRRALGAEASLAKLERAARARQEAAYAALAALLAGPEFRAAMWRGMAVCALRPYAEPASDAPGSAVARVAALAGPLRPFAAVVLQRRWRRLRKAGRNIEELPPVALHELRLDVKRLRYASELFGPLWGGKAPGRFLRCLADVQEALGLANDAEVARGLSGGLTGVPPFAAGAVAGFSAGRAEGSREEALLHWAALLEVPRFWKGDLPRQEAQT